MKKLRTEIKQEDLHEMVAEVRRKAWLRQGKHDTVQRLRHDPGFAKAVVEQAIHAVATLRAPYFRDAMNAAQRNKLVFERNLREGKGIWFDEMEPLAPKERTHVLKQLRNLWDIPEPTQH